MNLIFLRKEFTFFSDPAKRIIDLLVPIISGNGRNVQMKSISNFPQFLAPFEEKKTFLSVLIK